MLFKDINIPKESWFWIEPKEEDKKDEEDKEDECTSADLSVSVSSSTELIAQFKIKFNIPWNSIYIYTYMYKGYIYIHTRFPHCSKGPLCNPRAVSFIAITR